MHHQPLSETDHVGHLVNDNANQVRDMTQRGLEEGGVPRDIAWRASDVFIGALVLLIVGLYIQHRFFQRSGAFFRPPPKKKGKKKK